jgi:ZIP family zinc transporter
MNEALFFSMCSGLTIVAGAAMVIVREKPFSERGLAAALGLSAGAMTFVTLLHLLPLVWIWGSWPHVVMGSSLGMLWMLLFHRHRSPKSFESSKHGMSRVGNVMAVAVILHNLPEGAAIGVGFDLHAKTGIALVIALSLHNVPEGIGMALPMMVARRPRMMVLAYSVIAGAALPVGTWMGTGWWRDAPDVVAVGLMLAVMVMMGMMVREVAPRAWILDRKWALGGAICGMFLMYTIHVIHG